MGIYAADTGSIPRCGKRFSSQSRLSVQTVLRCPCIPVCNRTHQHLCARERSCSPCQSSVDYGNANTSSMHRRLGSATLSQLAFPKGRQFDFPMREILLDFAVVKSQKVSVNTALAHPDDEMQPHEQHSSPPKQHRSADAGKRAPSPKS